MPDIVLGCDPEVFVRNRETQEFVSGHGLIPGTKDAPHLVDHGMVQVDGMALEFGIDPAPDEDTFVNNIAAVLEQLTAMLPDELELHFNPTAIFSNDTMAAQPQEALELGCEPDYNAYTGEFNPAPDVSNTPNMRSAGGHVHIGWGRGFATDDRRHINACCALAQVLDKELGLASLNWDTNSERRMLYGAAGAFRPKSYGMEYRSLSCMWVSEERLQRVVFRQTMKGVQSLIKGEVPETTMDLYMGCLSLDIQRAILNSDNRLLKGVFDV